MPRYAWKAEMPREGVRFISQQAFKPTETPHLSEEVRVRQG